MQAKPGPVKRTKTVTRTFSVPPKPPNLTPAQENAWAEVCANPYLMNGDQSLVLEYIKTVCLGDAAFESLTKDGLYIDDAKGSMKTNPAYKIYRDATERVLKLRTMLLMTPQSRLNVKVTIEEPEEQDGLAALAD
jgi:P27 family predicted phage terminase small subunit